MASFNCVMIMGNLVRDPELKYLPSQTAIVTFGVAVNEKFKGKDGNMNEKVHFFDCTAFGKTAEVINQYLCKGKGIFIQGKLDHQTWEDKQGGGKRSKVAIIVEKFQFVGGKDGGGGGDDSDQRPQTRQTSRPASRGGQTSKPPEFEDEQKFNDEDIPF